MYNAADFASYFGNLVSNRIFYATADNLKIIAATGMTVSAQAGAAFINGYHYENTAPLDLSIQTAHGVYPRIDRVVVRLSMVDREIKLAVVTGTPAESPSAPALTRTADVYELCVAEVTVPQGAVEIISGNISDTRLDMGLCGLLNSLVSAVYE